MKLRLGGLARSPRRIRFGFLAASCLLLLSLSLSLSLSVSFSLPSIYLSICPSVFFPPPFFLFFSLSFFLPAVLFFRFRTVSRSRRSPGPIEIAFDFALLPRRFLFHREGPSGRIFRRGHGCRGYFRRVHLKGLISREVLRRGYIVSTDDLPLPD